MIKIGTILTLFSVVSVCSMLHESSKLQLETKSVDSWSVMKKGTVINNVDHGTNLTEAVGKFLSRKTVKGQVLASYNDSMITAIQRHLKSLRLSSETLKLNGIERENLPLVLARLADDFGFDNIYSKSSYSQELNSSRISYENLFTSDTSNRNNHLAIKYILILGQLNNNSIYTVHFVFVNITSEILIETLLNQNPKDFAISHYMKGQKRQLNIVRTSKLTSTGKFLNEHLRILVTSWHTKTTEIVLNMLRFHAATLLVPQRYRMLSYFQKELILPGRNRRSNTASNSETISDKTQALTTSISAVLAVAKEFIQLFKSSSSLTIQRIVRFGFHYFSQKSTVLKAFDIPKDMVKEFVNAVIMDYNLPPKSTLKFALKFSPDLTWEQIQYVYSPEENGRYNFLMLLKNSDSIKKTASFVIIDIDANWKLAPDLLLITETESKLGGFFSSSSQSIQNIPHALTLDEALQLKQFFMFVAMEKLANNLGIRTSILKLK